MKRLHADPAGFSSLNPGKTNETWRLAPAFGLEAFETTQFFAPPEEADEIGRLGNYRVLRPLGTGGMGMVYLAEQISPRRLVALKMVAAGPGISRERLTRFRREAELIAGLQHPHIVTIYEVGDWTVPGTQRCTPYFAMEYVPGGSLAERLVPGPLTAKAAAELVETLARAVAFAHAHGVVHRDLKPANVLLAAADIAPSTTHDSPTTNHQPKIADFGLAKQLEGDDNQALGYRTQSGAILGTPAYMALEQAAGRESGPATDIYALGAILYEALTRRPPFSAAGVLETLDQVRHQELLPPRRLQPDVPRDLETICLKCLEKDSRRRYATASDLADDLASFLRAEPIRARPVSTWERAVKWARRRPAAAGLVAVCLAATVVLVLVAVTYERRLRTTLVETKVEKARADANYREAGDTLRRVLDHARAKNGQALPGLMDLQRRQHEEALAFFLYAAKQQGSGPDVRYDVATALLEASQMQLWLGQANLALENRQRARRELQALVEEFPDRPAYRYQLAQALLVIARVPECSLTEAEDGLSHALLLVERLERDEPEKLDYQIVKATVLQQLGITYQLEKKLDKAEEYYRQTVLQATRLCEQQPEARMHRVLLANTLINLGSLLRRDKHAPNDCYERAAAILQKLRQEDRDDAEVIHSLAGLYVNWADARVENGQAEAALADLDENVTYLERLLEREPAHAGLRADLFRMQGRRGQILERLGRFDEAATAWEKVVQFSSTPGEADYYRLFVAATCANAGQHARANRIMQDWLTRTTPKTPADQLSHCVEVYCTMLKKLGEGPSGASSESQKLVEHYGMHAIDLLRTLEARAYFADLEQARWLNNDFGLNPLRKRADFQDLLQKVKGK
jgi:tetratricopeptide (TPR) repeat protein